MDRNLLAFDIGASGGRAILGRLSGGKISIAGVYRFPNEPVIVNGAMHWDILALWSAMCSTLVAGGSFDSVGVDTWGVDFGLLGERGELLGNPFHYRDSRVDGVMDRVIAKVGRERIYGVTGIQFMSINTLYQVVWAAERTPKMLQAAQALLTIPDLLNFWLTGRIACEYTNATTTQFLDGHSRDWSRDLLGELGVPTHMLVEVIQPGTVLGPLQLPGFESTLVVAPACHDTGSAVAAVRAGGKTAFLSSGTWSLLGTEVPKAIAGPEAQRLNFTNEGGVCGTVRLLKNITGMWLLECCRKVWGSASWDDLLQMSAQERPFQHLVDPDCPDFTRPDDMTAAISAYCMRTSQRAPQSRGSFVRCVLESLALKYRVVLEQLQSLTGVQVEEIRVIGGGSQNSILNQMTADATGCRVLAGPAEATALGNLAMQMVGTGVVASLDDARDMIAQSFPPVKYEPRQAEQWDKAYRDFCSLIR